MSRLPPASVEQQAVLDHLHRGNVVVDSVAGSGKTTCNLHLACFFEHVRPEWNVSCLLLTYNAKLKLETRVKVAQLGLRHRMEVHSFHAFCVKYYSPNCFYDKAIVQMLHATRSRERYPVRRVCHSTGVQHQSSVLFADYLKAIPAFDVVIVDEAQDLTPTLYELVCKIVADVSLARRLRGVVPLEPRLLILGDRHQSIYGFMDADERYLKYAKELFSMWSFSRPLGIPTPMQVIQQTSTDIAELPMQVREHMPIWSSLRLTESFRVTQPMSNFINKCMLHTDSPDEGHHIRSSKPSTHKPRYRICDSFNDAYAEFDYYLNQCGYSADDIFVLAPSIKSPMCPARRLENLVKEWFGNKIQIYAPNDDDQRLDESILAGKLVFSTFHQAKGLERKCVIVFGFDGSYFRFYKRNYDPHTCPNEFYVACTRASEHLSLIHDFRNEYLPFLDEGSLPETCQIFSDRPILDSQPEEDSSTSNKMIEVSVTKLLDHLPERILTKCMKLVTVCDLESPEKGKLMPGIESKVQMRHGSSNSQSTFEGVSDINGTAIPMWYEYRLKGEMTIQKQIVGIESKGDHDADVYRDAVNLAVSVRESRKTSEDIEAKDGIAELDNVCTTDPTVSEVLEMANHWQSYIGGYVFKVYQITDYNWLSQLTLERCVGRMAQTLKIGQSPSHSEQVVADANRQERGDFCLKDGDDCQGSLPRATVASNDVFEERLANVIFELRLEMEGLPNYPNRKLVGAIDCLDMNLDAQKLYEFKCTRDLDAVHVLQVVCYAYLLKKVQEDKAMVSAGMPSWISDQLARRKRHDILVTDQNDIHDGIQGTGMRCSDTIASDSQSSSDCELMSIRLPGDEQSVDVADQHRLLDEAKRRRLEYHDDDKDAASQTALVQKLHLDDDPWTCHLYNILTDDLKLVSCDSLDQVMAIILEAKFGKQGNCTDDLFLQQSETIKAMYYE